MMDNYDGPVRTWPWKAKDGTGNISLGITPRYLDQSLGLCN